jgi:regulator of protease activity HflC (stomatin/prohibitin superfamily)
VRRRSAAVPIVSMIWFTTVCVVIEDGEVGVSKSLGAIRDEPLPAGVAFVAPVVRQVETWNVKLQELKETAQVPSSEGLIVGLETSLLFHVVPERAPEIRKTVGRSYADGLVAPYFRSALRGVVSGYPVKQIYTEVGRKEIAENIRSSRRSWSPAGSGSSTCSCAT